MKRAKRQTGNWKLTGRSKLETRKSKIGTAGRRKRKQKPPLGPGLAPAKAVLKNRKAAIENRKSKALPLLLEVGCEEIPARFLTGAEKQFGERLQAALAEARLLPQGPALASVGSRQGAKGQGDPPVQCYSTPRRLVLHAPAVLEKQPDKVEEIVGPPAKVAFDAAGEPTRAAESFAEKQGAALKDLVRVSTAKGEYLAIKKTTRGRPALELLPQILPQAVLGMSFPKSMYWVGISGPRFVRPIRWVLARLGEGKQGKVVPFEITGVKSGDVTYGHRSAGKRGIRVASFRDYTQKLAAAHVQVDAETRRKAVLKESKVLLEKKQLTIVQDAELLDWIVNSTEWPHPLLGSFDERFLHLPREILVTVMRDHQKYFAVEDRQGRLQPFFVAILNMDGDPRGLIRQGHERVLAARFADAEFFWDVDLKMTLFERSSLLEGVTYQAELGTYAEKTRRMREVGRELVRALGAAGKINHSEAEHALRAVDLAKCDLTTQMVQEFPELQGVVGGLYAAAQSVPESDEVAEAIYDHYRPVSAGDACPRSIVGAVVSLADKLDSVVGGFAVGHEPTGSSDPFALRRQGNAIIKVLLEFHLPLSLKEAVQQALQTLNIEWRTPQMEVFRRVLEFLGERLRHDLETRFRYDTVRAVLAAGWDVPSDALARAKALESLRGPVPSGTGRGSQDLEALCVAAKRIKNILAKSATAQDWEPGEVDGGLLTESAEQELNEAFRNVAEAVASLRESGEFRQALERISSLRPLVDRFFDKVLVMAEDRSLRQNRLRLLGKLDELFSGIASFAEIAPDSRG